MQRLQFWCVNGSREKICPKHQQTKNQLTVISRSCILAEHESYSQYAVDFIYVWYARDITGRRGHHLRHRQYHQSSSMSNNNISDNFVLRHEILRNCWLAGTNKQKFLNQHNSQFIELFAVAECW